MYYPNKLERDLYHQFWFLWYYSAVTQCLQNNEFFNDRRWKFNIGKYRFDEKKRTYKNRVQKCATRSAHNLIFERLLCNIISRYQCIINTKRIRNIVARNFYASIVLSVYRGMMKKYLWGGDKHRRSFHAIMFEVYIRFWHTELSIQENTNRLKG